MQVIGSELLDLIAKLTSIPSPTGYSREVITFVQEYLERIKVSSKLTNKGALIVTLPGEDQAKHRLLTAHVDTLGAMVKEIKDSGRLKLTMLGGSLWNHIEGEYCQIITASGKRYSGTIMMHQTATHVYKDAGEAKRDQDNIEVRIDAKVDKGEDVRALGIGVGDFVAFDPRVEVTDSGFIKSRHLDDKASVGILLYLINKLVTDQISLPYTTHFLISNHEEVGHGGNSNIPKETVEYLAVDMGAIGDGQATDEYTVSICAKDSSGPYNYQLREHLVQLAKDNQIGYQVDIYPYYGSDASAALSAGHDLVHGLIGPGIDGSHAFERTHRESLVNTTQLIYHYLLSPIREPN